MFLYRWQRISCVFFVYNMSNQIVLMADDGIGNAIKSSSHPLSSIVFACFGGWSLACFLNDLFFFDFLPRKRSHRGSRTGDDMPSCLLAIACRHSSHHDMTLCHDLSWCHNMPSRHDTSSCHDVHDAMTFHDVTICHHAMTCYRLMTCHHAVTCHHVMTCHHAILS